MFITTVCVGLLHLTIGQARLGNLIKLVPQTVIIGVMNGIILLVAIYQVPWLTGIDPALKPTDSDVFWYLGALNWVDLMVGLTTICIICIIPRVAKRLPAMLTGMIALLVGLFLNYAGRAQAEIERQNFLTTVRGMQTAVLLQSIIRPTRRAPGDNPAKAFYQQFGMLPAGYMG